MVLRDRKINYKSDNVQLHCSFGVPDCRAFIKMYAEMCGDIQISKDCPSSEHDVRYWLENDGRAFLSWPVKWRKELSAWCFATAVRNKFLVPTSADGNRFYLSDSFFAKRGRPRKDD